MFRCILSKAANPSSAKKSPLVIWNNNVELHDEKQSMMPYITTPTLNYDKDTKTATISGARIGMHLVDINLKYTKGSERYHYFLNSHDAIVFMSHPFKSKQGLGLKFKVAQSKQSCNLEIRYKQELKQSMMTFFNVENSEITKIKRFSADQQQMIVMKQLMRGGLYDISGMDMSYSIKYDKLIDELMEEANEPCEQQVQELAYQQEYQEAFAV